MSANALMMNEELRDEAIERAEAFRNLQDSGASSKIICAAKRLIFEDTQSNELDTRKPGKLAQVVAAVKYIVEEVMELTPDEYDAIYSTVLNQKSTLDHAIRKIVNAAPSRIVTNALFDSKSILFAMVWPEYYEEHFQKPTAMMVFDAKGEVRGNLIRAGKVKEAPIKEGGTKQLSNGKFSSAKEERKRVYNRGEEVDRLVFWSMKEILPLFEMDTPKLFYSLAKPKSSGWSKFGFVNVIKARECYPSPLDFYFWNSAPEYQFEHIEEYMAARKKAKLEPLEAVDIMYEAYKRTKDKYLDLD